MPGEHQEIKQLLEENLAWEKKNYELLEKMHKYHVYTFWMKFVWFAIVIGLPFIFFYVFMQPYLALLGVSGTDVESLLKDLPGVINSPMGKIMQ